MKLSYKIRNIGVGISILIFFNSCHKGLRSQAKTTSDSTEFVLNEKDISPLLQYELKELGDFNAPASQNPVFPSLKVSPRVFNTFNFKDTRYIHFLNGKKLAEKKKERILHKIKENDIESMEFISGEEAIELYGEKAAYGVVIMRTKHK